MPVPLMTTLADDKMGAASVATGQPQLNRGSFELKFANDLSAHIRYAGRATFVSLQTRRLCKIAPEIRFLRIGSRLVTRKIADVDED